MAQLFWLFFCHIMKNIHQDDVDDNKVIKKSLRLLLIHVILENLLTCCKKRACIISAIDSCSLSLALLIVFGSTIKVCANLLLSLFNAIATNTLYLCPPVSSQFAEP